MISLGLATSRCLHISRCHKRICGALAATYSTGPVSSTSTTSKPDTKKHPKEPNDKWNYNKNKFVSKPSDEQLQYELVTANTLEKRTVLPQGVKMLARDFIEDSLYNPNYGYFPKQAVIFNGNDANFDFPLLRSSVEFQEVIAAKYSAYGSEKYEGPGRQIWHTPTELFKPWYGRAVGQCLVSEYLLKYFPYEDFVIYEIGAGNGTLAENILDYLKEVHPDVYERTRYNIIEISGNLANLQRLRLRRAHPSVKIYHKSIFHWKAREPSPCYFIAMEVVDNFAHDIVRYDLKTLEPYQGIVTIDHLGDFDLIYSRITDPLILSFLDMQRRLGHTPPISRLLESSPTLRSLFTSLPFAPNLSKEEYIPTRLLSLLLTLRNHFPRHRLLLSDFSSLPDAIPGVNAPVVQTRVRNTTVPCSTLLVRQGYFDIFFPTNFERLRDMYEFVLAQPPDVPPLFSENAAANLGGVGRLPLESHSTPLRWKGDFFTAHNRRSLREGVPSSTGLPVGERKSSVLTHAEFLKTYADLSKTKLRNGENPMLDFYKNVKFLF